MKKKKESELYGHFRWFFTQRGFLVIGGKSAQQNELIIKKHLDRPDYVLHTEAPGSPFTAIKEFSVTKKSVKQSDINEAAAFCASFSRGWKAGKLEMPVGVFRPVQITKKKGMHPGSFLIKGTRGIVKAKLRLVLTRQQGKLRAVPKAKKYFAVITPGKLAKERAAELISKRLRISKDEVLSALPAGSFEIKWV